VDKHRAKWSCEICSEPIEDGAGCIHLPDGDSQSVYAARSGWERAHPNGTDVMDLIENYPEPLRWSAQHFECCSEPDGPEGYGFAVERARTPEQLLAWTAHLMGKGWFNATDWDEVLERQLESWGVGTLLS
jgi:hypothetical protein